MPLEYYSNPVGRSSIGKRSSRIENNAGLGNRIIEIKGNGATTGIGYGDSIGEGIA